MRMHKRGISSSIVQIALWIIFIIIGIFVVTYIIKNFS